MLALALLGSGLSNGQEGLAANRASDSEALFSDWAAAHLQSLSSAVAGDGDLVRIGNMLGEAPLVALGEGVHLAAEPLEFRNRLFRYLVEKKGFTAIAIESGLVEGREVHDYVLGGAGELKEIVRHGFTWTFDRLPQNQNLVAWLRSYNSDPEHSRKVNFYGIDLPGSPSAPDANRGNNVALVECLRFLQRVDPVAATIFHKRLAWLLPRLGFYANGKAPANSYNALSQSQRDALTAAIADLVATLERNEGHYIAASTQEEYEWVYRAAVGQRQVDDWLRQFPLHYMPGVTQAQSLIAAGDTRGRAMADNLQWVIDREGPRGKILIFAHTVHLSTAPVGFRWHEGTQAAHTYVESNYEQEVAGTWLRRRYGDHLVAVGGFVGEGIVGYLGFQRQLAAPPELSIGRLLQKLGSEPFVLDLRTAPSDISDELTENRLLGPTEQAFGLDVGFDIKLSQAFDLVVFFNHVSPAGAVD